MNGLKIKIADRWVGDGHPCFIIAEAGSNHNGRLEQAFQLIDAAAGAGADAVKFQTFRAKTMYARTAGRVQYLKKLRLDKPVYDLIKSMEMPLSWIPKLAEHSRRKKIIFLSTPFDELTADRLEAYVPAYKIASYEMTHLPLIQHVARKGKPLIISTGAADPDEIRETVRAVQEAGNQLLCLMQCTARYPAPLGSLNLRTIPA